MRKQSSAIVGIFLMILCLILSSELYAAEAILYGSDADLQKLYTIDKTNASAIEVGSFGVGGYMAGLAYDADNDIMYGTTTGTDRLYSIDYRTGGANFIGDLGVTLMHGLAYDNSTDTLFGVFGKLGDDGLYGDGLYQIDVSTGNSTLIGNIGYYNDNHENTVHGLAVHPITNDLYGITGGMGFGSAMVRIDKTTGSGTFLHEYNIYNGMTGLAFLPDGTLYAINNQAGALFTLDILSGSIQCIGYTGYGNALGLTCVPEPTTVLLLALGSLIIARRRR